MNDLPDNLISKVRLFADDCILYRVIHSKVDEDILQDDLHRLHLWAEKNSMTINSSKSKTITFGRGRKYTETQYRLGNENIPRVVSCKYLGIIFDSKLSWEDQVNFVVGKAWKSLHFTMRILKKSTAKARELAYISLVRPLMEYGTVCWDPYRISQKEYLNRVQRRACKFIFRSNRKKVEWESLEIRRVKARLCALYKAYVGYPAWKDIHIRLSRPTYFSRGDHKHKIQFRPQRTDVGKFSFTNRSITDWNKLPATALEPFPLGLQRFKSKLTNDICKFY